MDPFSLAARAVYNGEPYFHIGGWFVWTEFSKPRCSGLTDAKEEEAANGKDFFSCTESLVPSRGRYLWFP